MIEDHCEVREIMGTVDYMRKLNVPCVFRLFNHIPFFPVSS